MNKKQYLTRLDPQLSSDLDRWLQADGRSINDVLAFALEQMMAADPNPTRKILTEKTADPQKTHSVSTRLSYSDYARFESFAATKGVNASTLLGRVIARALDCQAELMAPDKVRKSLKASHVVSTRLSAESYNLLTTRYGAQRESMSAIVRDLALGSMSLSGGVTNVA